MPLVEDSFCWLWEELPFGFGVLVLILIASLFDDGDRLVGQMLVIISFHKNELQENGDNTTNKQEMEKYGSQSHPGIPLYSLESVQSRQQY